jgi:muramoyltetrapeptide carboxypeptidase LdcA involved in peptidoglycan recycling
MKKLIKPNKLSHGDKVAIVSPSWGGPSSIPHRYKVGKDRLEQIFGLEVIAMKNALRDPDWLYCNPQARADDLMEAFSDPSIQGIFSSIGGDDAVRLMPFVDLNIIQNNPKIFMGFSDTTVIHFMCRQAGLSSFYGPAVMTSFAENVHMHDYTIQSIQKTLFSNQIIGEIPVNTLGWTKQFLEWSIPENQSIVRKLNSCIIPQFMGDSSKTVQGRLIGGCVEVLQFINGTALWPKLEDWKNSILFIETSEEGITPIALTRFLRNLAAQNILSNLQGILFSKPGGPQIHADFFSDYDTALLAVFEEYQLPLIPIVTKMDFGHTDPRGVLPYGCLTEINPLEKTVTLLENGVI